jgi:serine/threonine-protein kinase PknG
MTVTSTLCGRPGCSGTILDGYCDTCGLAPAPAGAAASGRTAASGPVSGRVDVSRLTTRSTRSTSTGTTTRRSRVGAGVVEITPVTAVDPATVVMADPSVPEGRRFCTRCDSPVGRGKNGVPGRQVGFCSKCGARFDFGAKLVAGELVAGQYEVAGALAHGGLGWIYLARDQNVSGRWCVLKGLLDAADPDAAAAAVAERQFLAEVHYPSIVEIFNFVQHGGQGYIVMEYVGGPSLKQLAKQRRQDGLGAMPVTTAAAYMLAVLPALGYLHDRGLVYCDFKPDNVIHVGDAVKLIDMGGVRRLDDPNAAIFGTMGYQAPEVARTGPTVASDLYTMGRSLAVLVLDWPEWQNGDRERLPARADHEVLIEHDSLWRFLLRACATAPAERFQDADEMADALHGVLCQVAAAGDGVPRPRTSTRFSPPRHRLDGKAWTALPVPLLPNHPRLANRVAGVTDGDADATLRLARADEELSWADIATVARAYCELGGFSSADSVVGQLDAGSPDAAGFESVIATARSYLHGVSALAAGDPARATTLLQDAYATAPGESATALAYAAALSGTGADDRLPEAADLYQQVAETDPSWVVAVAGLAETLTRLDRKGDAARVLVAVPESHPLRARALTLACRLMAENGYDETVAAAAGDHLRGTRPGKRDIAEAELAATLYQAALAALARGEKIGKQVAGRPPHTADLATAAESALLEMASATPDLAQRQDLLDAAARTRPWSLW